MSKDWERLAQAIEAARDAKGLTQVGLAKAAGVSESTVQNFEAGVPRTRTPVTLSKVEAALGWAPGSGASVLSGGDPTPLSSDKGVAPPEYGGDLPIRIQQALADGPLVDARIVELEDDSGARMIVVVRGKAGASPADLKRALEAWEGAEARITSDPNSAA